MDIQKAHTGQSSFMRYTQPGERRVARALINAALDKGYTVSVNDGEEWTVRRSSNLREITDALATTGEDFIRFYDGDKSVGTFNLIWGNDETGAELISDYSYNDICNELHQRATD
jgi:hypothetical protein